MHAYKSNDCVTVDEPVHAEIRFTLVEREGELFAELNTQDLQEFYEKLPHGASRTERGEIECYLCEVAEH